MNCQFTMRACAIVVGASGLTSCQPPTPRIVKAEAPAYAMVTPSGTTTQEALGPFDPVEQAIQVPDLNGLLAHYMSRHR